MSKEKYSVEVVKTDLELNEELPLGQGAASVTFYLIPQTIGSIKGTLLVNNTEFKLSQFIFP